jgi:multiple sugar transport system substrate-binding protein
VSRHGAPSASLRLLTLFAVGLLSPVLGGCLNSAGREGAGLVLLAQTRADDAAVWSEVVAKFTEETKVKLRLERVDAERYYAELNARAAAGRPPDVVQMESGRLPEFAARGLLLNLDTYLRQEPNLLGKDFQPGVWQSFHYQGGLYGVPGDVSVLAVVLNEDLLEAKYLPVPKPGWTWGDYLRDAKSVTADTDGDGRTDVYGTSTCPWWQVLVWQNGGDLVDDPANPTRSTLGAPEAKAALQWLADLAVKHKVAPPVMLSDLDQVRAFANGSIGMIYAGRWDIAAFTTRAGFRWNYVPLPRGKRPANLGASTAFCVMQDCRRPTDAWRLVQYLTVGQGQQSLLKAGITTPAYTPLLRSEYFEGAKKGGQDAFASGAKLTHPLPCTVRYGDIAAVWREELAPLWSGQASVEEVTRRIDDRVNRILSETKPASAWLGPVSPRG